MRGEASSKKATVWERVPARSSREARQGLGETRLALNLGSCFGIATLEGSMCRAGVAEIWTGLGST